MTARLLCVGDIHLGRRPSRLPDDLARFGLAATDLTPAAAWLATVERALQLEVDAVVLAGDVVDRVEDRFEAYAPLRAGVERLVGAGVPVHAVAGNHDVDALPRLAQQIPAFKLLGAGGVWEHVHVPARTGPGVELLGWSFPQAQVHDSPIDSLRHTPGGGIATLGVLHCDVDAGGGPYAPVTRAGLMAVPVDAWLLGHVHRPDPLDGERPAGYLGSLMGLDPGEVGRRGPWLVEVDGPGRVRAQPLSIAPLRYERVDVTLSSSPRGASPEDAEDVVFGALAASLRSVAARLADEPGADALRLVACRIGVSGAGRHEPRVRALLDAYERHPTEERDGVHYFIESLDERARPDLDLESIAAGDDPPALLARRLLALAQGDAEADALKDRARRAIEGPLSAPRWARLVDLGRPPQPLRDVLLRAGTRRLEALLAQRPSVSTGDPGA